MDYLKTLQNIEEYYTNLLIVQYHNKPKARKTIKLMARLLWTNMVLLQIRDAFDWKTATGMQLDIIGKWVGVDRFYKGQLFDFHPLTTRITRMNVTALQIRWCQIIRICCCAA